MDLSTIGLLDFCLRPFSVPSLGTSEECPGDWHIHMVAPLEDTDSVCQDDVINPTGLHVDRISFEENGEFSADDEEAEFSHVSTDAGLFLLNVLSGVSEDFSLDELTGFVASFNIRGEFVDNNNPTIGTLLAVCLDPIHPLEAEIEEDDDD